MLIYSETTLFLVGICSKLTIKRLENDVKYAQKQQKRHQSYINRHEHTISRSGVFLYNF